MNKLPISKDAAGGDKAMNRVTDSSNQDPELIPVVERFLLDTEYHRSQIFIIREIVPMFRAVEVFLVGLLFDRSKFEALIFLPLFLDGGFLSRHIIRINLVLFEQAETVVLSLQHRRTLLHRLFFRLLRIGSFAIALALVPDRVRCDLLPRTFDPVARRWYQVVRKLLTEFIYGKIYPQLAYFSLLQTSVRDERTEIFRINSANASR